MPRYVIRHTGNAPNWVAADTCGIDFFHPSSSDHRPHTIVRAVTAAGQLWVRFDVNDRYVRSIFTTYLDPVYRDSCVEFFVRPDARSGYFNFEVNCGGTLLLYYIQDWRRKGDSFERFRPVKYDDARDIVVSHTLPQVVEPEIPQPVTWSVTLAIPLVMLQRYLGSPLTLERPWRGNFYKCGDDTSHPHWAAWAPIGERLDFHQPEQFGELVLDTAAAEDRQPTAGPKRGR